MKFGLYIIRILTNWCNRSPRISAANISRGNFAAFLAYASRYELPMVVHNCPNLAIFQVDHPTAHIWPFSKVSPSIILRGVEIIALSSLAAQAVSSPPPAVCPCCTR